MQAKEAGKKIPPKNPSKRPAGVAEVSKINSLVDSEKIVWQHKWPRHTQKTAVFNDRKILSMAQDEHCN